MAETTVLTGGAAAVLMIAIGAAATGLVPPTRNDLGAGLSLLFAPAAAQDTVKGVAEPRLAPAPNPQMNEATPAIDGSGALATPYLLTQVTPRVAVLLPTAPAVEALAAPAPQIPLQALAVAPKAGAGTGVDNGLSAAAPVAPTAPAIAVAVRPAPETQSTLESRPPAYTRPAPAPEPVVTADKPSNGPAVTAEPSKGSSPVPSAPVESTFVEPTPAEPTSQTSSSAPAGDTPATAGAPTSKSSASTHETRTVASGSKATGTASAQGTRSVNQ